MKFPPDLVAALCALFGETLVYYLFSYLLMPYLVEELHLSNMQAGMVYAAFGAALLIMTMAFGSLIDRLLLRRTLQLQLGVGALAMVCMGAWSNVWWTGAMLFGPLSFALAVGLPALPVAVRRYTSPAGQTLGFGVLYVVMSLGTALSQLAADGFRIYVLPWSGLAPLAGAPAYALLFWAMALVHFVNFVVVTVFVRDVHVVDDTWALSRSLAGGPSAPTAKVGIILKSHKFW